MMKLVTALALVAVAPVQAMAFARPIGPQSYCTPDRIGVVAMLDATNIVRCEGPNTYIIINDSRLSTAQRDAVVNGRMPFSDAVKATAP